jgi:NAD(P)-dependent dehydrogenase (short-subunit alcohol dehydrogenase family)
MVPSQMEAHSRARIAPEEIAPVLVFLAADESRHVTGQIFGADDGMTAWR